jgi:hypothetical protein
LCFPDDFSEEIDLEARRLLQLFPAYDPGAGQVSAECKRHSDIFHEELAKFTLWALKSKWIDRRSEFLPRDRRSSSLLDCSSSLRN